MRLKERIALRDREKRKMTLPRRRTHRGVDERRFGRRVHMALVDPWENWDQEERHVKI